MTVTKKIVRKTNVAKIDPLDFHYWLIEKRKLERKLNATVIAAFCIIINEAGIDSIGNEKAQNYCKRICDKYALKYTENVRKSFGIIQPHKKQIKKQVKKIIELILPKLNTDKTKISFYINKNYI